MKSTYATLMQSKFFTPALNSALFDGPVRIYFSQNHEATALKIYFILQNQYPADMERAKDLHRFVEKNILVMLYPNSETFELCCDSPNQALVEADLEGDSLIAVNGPAAEDLLRSIVEKILRAVRSWEEDEHYQNSFLETTP
jgi:hypothetical protein